jgi:hypothetical protein
MLHFETANSEHCISIEREMTPTPASLFPEETVQAIRDEMKPFPIGELDHRHADEPTLLFYQRATGEFFAATLDQIADAWAVHLDRKARAEQKKKIRTLYWKTRNAGRKAA